MQEGAHIAARAGMGNPILRYSLKDKKINPKGREAESTP